MMMQSFRKSYEKKLAAHKVLPYNTNDFHLHWSLSPGQFHMST